MAGFLRKLFGHQQTPQSNGEDTDLEKFYTNSEHALQIFEQLITTTCLSKRLLVIHGLGGVGKSTLLKMYALACHYRHIPVALVASEEVPSPVDMLADWAEDLSQNGITIPAFRKTLTHYRAILAKVEDESKKGHQAKSQIAGTMGKTAAKTAINMAASVIPVVGPLVGALGGESAEAFIDWLRSFLSKPDMELYLDPAKRLESDFLSDLTPIASRQRIVLMTDTYEQMAALDDWMRELTRRLPKNVLLVIAGRTIPEWNRAWQDWMGMAEIIELKEMTPDDIHTLVHRYYAFIRSGDPDPKQTEAIVQFARGLPMVATTVVQLWVKYGLEDFQSVRPQVVADLVDRLLEGVPQEMRPAFEVAAVLRYFNVEALGALLDGGNAEGLYAELRRWPFIRPRREGLAVHDTMREMINEALHVRTPERLRTLHERAAAYYEALLEKAPGDEREHYTYERLYHRVRVDEVSGIQLFQEIAEERTRYRMVNQLRALLKDVNTYPVESENSKLWRGYYNASLANLEVQRSRAEEMYQAITENERAEPKLRAYALCDWGGILSRRERTAQPGAAEKAVHLLESSINVGVATDVKLVMNWLYLSEIYRGTANWEKAFFYLDHPRRFFIEHGDPSGLLTVLWYEREIYNRRGNLRKLFDVEKEMWKTYTAAGEPSYLRPRLSPLLGRLWAGHYTEAEREYRIALGITKSLQDQEFLNSSTRDLALCLSFQGKCSEALARAEEGLSLARSMGGTGDPNEVFLSLTLYGITCLKCGELDSAEKYLTQAIPIGQNIRVNLDRTLEYLATLNEVLKRFDEAEYFYQLFQKEAQELADNYSESGALTGMVRVKHAKKEYPAILSLWSAAEQLAQEYEYNDYFTSLYLIRGHMTWDSLTPEWENGFDSAFHCYQLALIYALRFNRFLLDEALSGREQGTPFRPIILHCLERGKEGQRMLTALRDWWQSGTNDVGTSRPDTISLITEGLPLLEAERIARQNESGDGSPQKSVVEQINMALQQEQGR
jgi:tetratricopeptide (TPR) repeat protein